MSEIFRHFPRDLEQRLRLGEKKAMPSVGTVVISEEKSLVMDVTICCPTRKVKTMLMRAPVRTWHKEGQSLTSRNFEAPGTL